MELKFKVNGMTCAACSARVEKVAGAVEGVTEAQVNLLAGTLTVQTSSANSAEKIVLAVANAGYEAYLFGSELPKQQEKTQGDREIKLRIVFSVALLAVLMYFTMGHMVGLPLPHWYHGTENALIAAFLQFLLTLPVVILNRSYFTKGFKALIHRSPNMDSLIAVGSGAALVYGVAALMRMMYAMGHGDLETVARYSENLYFESAAMILTLITVGKFLESRAKGKTGDAVRALMDLRPKTATVLRDGAEVMIPAEQVRVGDIVIVRSGGRIPVDGVVIEGRAAIDQSALTGESVPVEVSAGDSVAAATINTEGYIRFEARKVGEDTTLQQVIRLVEEAGGSKAPIARLADKVAGIFVPVVMGIAAFTFAGWMLGGYGLEFSLNCAISVLVISCPCALGLATPVAIMVATGRGASMGVLFKNARSLEQLHNIDTVVLDKTGTLTVGKPSVTDVLADDRNELLTIAASIEQFSEHLFAKAIMEKAEGMALREATDFETLPGQGVTAKIGGVRYYGGNRRLMQEHGVEVPAYSEFAAQGKTVLYFADERGSYLGALAAADVLKKDSVAAVEDLRALGLQVVMLTGDNAQTAAAIAQKAQISQVVADVLPANKADAVKKLQHEGKKVLMVGDGINDAPALAMADVGMAIGAGTDVAMETADVVLMTGSLQGVCHAIALSRATVRNIRQNLFWAFFYNCLGIPVAAGVLFLPLGIQLSPMLGAAAMSISSVFVVTNALRLQRFKPHKKAKEQKVMETVIKVEGMMCSHCKARVEQVCKAVPGAADAVVDLQAKTVTVTGEASAQALKKAIIDAGYEVVE